MCALIRYVIAVFEAAIRVKTMYMRRFLQTLPIAVIHFTYNELRTGFLK